MATIDNAPSPPLDLIAAYNGIITIATTQATGTVAARTTRPRAAPQTPPDWLTLNPPPTSSYNGLLPPHRQNLYELAWAIPGNPAINFRIPPTTGVQRTTYGNRSNQSIRTSALAAGYYLALRFQRLSTPQGLDAFAQARAAEILRGVFPTQYWQPCEPAGRTIDCTFPASADDDTTPPIEYYDPANRRTAPSYTTISQRYPETEATPGTSTPPPGFLGQTILGRFTDIYHASLVQSFSLPRTIYPWEWVPCFAQCSASHQVTANNRPTRIQFSSKHKPHWLSDSASSWIGNAPLDADARFWEHNYALPPDAPPGYAQARNSNYILDLNINATIHSDDQAALTTIALNSSCAPARGRYYADSTQIQVDYDNQATVWLARGKDELDDPYAAPGAPPGLPTPFQPRIHTSTVSPTNGTTGYHTTDQPGISSVRPGTMMIFKHATRDLYMPVPVITRWDGMSTLTIPRLADRGYPRDGISYTATSCYDPYGKPLYFPGTLSQSQIIDRYVNNRLRRYPSAP